MQRGMCLLVAALMSRIDWRERSLKCLQLAPTSDANRMLERCRGDGPDPLRLCSDRGPLPSESPEYALEKRLRVGRRMPARLALVGSMYGPSPERLFESKSEGLSDEPEWRVSISGGATAAMPAFRVRTPI